MNFSTYGNVTQVQESYSDTTIAMTVIVMILYLFINYINGTLVHTFFKHEIFSENPRYILYIHMVVNDMIELTTTVMLYVIDMIFFTVNVSLCCFLIVTAVSTSVNTPLNLAGMAVERYIAICNPLRHAQICTVCRTYVLIGVIWVLGTIPTVPDLFVSLATEPLSFFYSKVYCGPDFVFRHPYLMEKRQILNFMCLSFVWFTLIYTYFRVMFAAKAVGADARKARSTILLHGLQLLLCMFTYVHLLLDDIFISLFPMSESGLKFASYLFFQMLPRLISPIIYGLRDQMFCAYLKKHFFCTIRQERSQRKTHPSELTCHCELVT